MGFLRFLGSLFFMILGFLVNTSQACKFYVGGRDGWVLNPTENYTLWAHRNRFQVNDTLYFKYKKGSDSALVVSGEDYNSCNTTNPKQKLTDGDSIFVLDHSGPFYFISGNSDHCNNGQKLFIIVMAIRPNPPSSPTTSPPTAKSPAGSIPDPPSHSGSQGFAGFVSLASFGVILILGSFFGMV